MRPTHVSVLEYGVLPYSGTAMSSASVEYMGRAIDNCLTHDNDEVIFADVFAWAKTGKRIAARIAIIAITTRSSMSVNALRMGKV
jgi:hypothetical protein